MWRVALIAGVFAASSAHAGLQFVAGSSNASVTKTSGKGAFDCNGTAGFTREAHIVLGSTPGSDTTQYVGPSDRCTTGVGSCSAWDLLGLGVRWNPGGGTKAVVCSCGPSQTSHTTTFDSAAHEIACVYCGNDTTTGPCSGRTAGDMCAFKDGTLISCLAGDVVNRTYDAAPSIGASSDATFLSTLNVTVEEVREWSGIRTAAQLATNSNCQISSGTAGLTSVWGMRDFSSGSCATSQAAVDDAATGNNDANCAGSIAPTWVSAIVPFACGAATPTPTITATPTATVTSTTVATATATATEIAPVATPTPSTQTAWYVGDFTAANGVAISGAHAAADDATCGIVGAGATDHPCLTLAWFTGQRMAQVQAGHIVRLTGTLSNCTTGGCSNQCLLAKAGVTFEGRTAADVATNSADATVIAGTNALQNGTCFGQAIRCDSPSPSACDFSNMTVRDLRFTDFPGGATGLMYCLYLQPSTNVSTLTFTRVHMDSCRGTDGTFSHIIGNAEGHGSDYGGINRNLTNVTLTDVEVNDTLGHGLFLGAINGATVTRLHAHHNGEGFCRTAGVAACTGNNTCPAGDCTSDDGLAIGGAMNLTITDGEFDNNRQDGIDFSGVDASDICAAISGVATIQGAFVHDNGNEGIVFANCAHDVTVKNSLLYNTGVGLGQHIGACKINVYHNTFYDTAGAPNVQIFDAPSEYDFRNNVFRCNKSDGRACVQLGAELGRVNSNSTWDYNLIQNAGTAGALRMVDFTASAPLNCASIQADVDYPCAKPACDPGGDTVYADTAGGLTSFQGASLPGFAAGFATHDTWNTDPTYVNAAAGTVAGFHLNPSDTIANDHGVALAAVTTDYDGDARPGSPAIGFDEPAAVGATATATPTPTLTATPTVTLTPTATPTQTALPTATPLAKARGVSSRGARF